MRFSTLLVLIVAAVVFAGCASRNEPKFADPADLMRSNGTPQSVVRPSNALTGRVVSVNSIGRFTVLSFPITGMPAIGQTLFVFRDGYKVGEAKVTGPQMNDKIVADLTTGEAQPGDEIRDR